MKGILNLSVTTPMIVRKDLSQSIPNAIRSYIAANSSPWVLQAVELRQTANAAQARVAELEGNDIALDN